MNIPNFITLCRMFLTPFVVWLLIVEQYKLSLLVFCLASASDAIDGWLARVTHTKTDLGTHLDPLADKLLLISTYITLGVFKLVPAWLVITVISRDVLILGGLLLAWFMAKPVEVRPLFISKANTLAQIVFLILALLQLAFADVPNVLAETFAYLVGALTVASGLAYLGAWFNHMSRVEG